MTALLLVLLQGADVQGWQHWSHFGSVADFQLVGDQVVCATSGGMAFGTLQGSYVQWDSVWTSPGELSSSDCRCVLVEPGPPRRIWIGTWGGGIDLFTEGSDWQHFGQLEGLPVSGEVSSLCLTDSSVIAGTSEGLATKELGYFQIWTELNTGGGLPDDIVLSVLPCDSGLYVGTYTGLALLAPGGYPGSPGSWTQSVELEGRQVRDVILHDDTVAVATDDGLWQAVPGGEFQKVTGFPGAGPLCVAATGGMLAAGDNSNVIIRMDGEWSLWPAIIGQLVRSIGLPGGQLVLAGLCNSITTQGDYGLGLARGWEDGWSTSYPAGLPSNDLRAVAVGPSGECWISTEHAGAAVLDQGSWTQFSDPFPSVHQMFAITVLPGGSVVVSHYHFGATWLDWKGTPESSDDEYVTWTSSSSGLLNDQVTALSTGQDGSIWFGEEPYYQSPSELSGVVRMRWTEGDPSSAEWTAWTPTEGLPSSIVTAVAANADGSAWVGTTSGLVLVGPDSYEVSSVISIPQGLPSAEVRSLALSRSGILYVGTTSGLASVDPGSWTATAIEEVGGTISALACDHLGAVWAAGSDALYRVDSDGSTTAYDQYNSPLPTTTIYGLACDSDAGILYACGEAGLWGLDLGSPLSGSSGAVLYPNPFVPGRGEVLGLAGIPDGQLTLRVFDLSGKLVYECDFPGRDSVAWDGDDSDGNPAAAGIYVVEIRREGASDLRKLAIVR
jgi:hypothetical protein